MELTVKEWNKLLDTYLITSGVDIELYNRTNDEQKWLLNEIKKSMERIKNK